MHLASQGGALPNRRGHEPCAGLSLPQGVSAGIWCAYTGTTKVQYAGELQVARNGKTEGLAMQLWPATIASPSHEAYAHVATIIVCFHNRTQHLLWREGAGGLSVSSQRVCMCFFYTMTCLSLRLARGFPDGAGARDHPHGRACTRAVRWGGHQHTSSRAVYRRSSYRLPLRG
jgi:hypothetical protein